MQRCLHLHNFSTVAAIVAGLESSLILRLKRTFELLSPKTQAMFQLVANAVSSDKNFSVYRDQLSKLNPPSVPFLGESRFLPSSARSRRSNPVSEPRPSVLFPLRSLGCNSAGVYLTFLTFIEDGNPNFLQGDRKLINFGKRMKSAGVLREMQTYQSVPYK